MKELHFTGQPIIYVDKTGLMQIALRTNCTKNKVWMCEGLNSYYNVSLKISLDEGQRLIVVYVGSSTGFIRGVFLCFQLDYHEEMDGKILKNRFSMQLLPNIPSNSIIIMANAAYHSTELNKKPASSTLKSDM